MKKNLIIIALFSLLSLNAFSQHTNHHAGHGSHGQAATAASSPELNVVLEKNDALFNEFLQASPQALEKRAEELHQAITKAKSSNVKGLVTAAGSLTKIKNKLSKDENLALYHDFMKNFAEVIKKSNVSKTHAVFYCPMVKKYWVQNITQGRDVKNVFAQDMLECGSEVQKET